MLIGLRDDQGVPYMWEQIAVGKGDFSDAPPLLMALFQERNKYCDFSVTELLNDPYQEQLTRRVDYFESVEELQDRLLGSALHAVMEKAGLLVKCQQEGELRRVRGVKIGPKVWTVGGTPDLIYENQLWDYKTITIAKLKRMARYQTDSMQKYKDQVNLYLWLLGKEVWEKVEKLYIRLVVRDWRFYEYREAGYDEAKYPKGAVIPIKKLDMPTIEAYAHKRLKLHVTAERLSTDKLHTAGMCDTWNGIRCSHYCSVRKSCWFVKQGKVPTV